MIGLDTNVLIRYLTQDDKSQSELANQLIDSLIRKNHHIFLNNIVLCELVWVLERGYKYERSLITSTLKYLLATEEFKFENLDILWSSLEDYEKSTLDFSDLLIGRINNKLYNCQVTMTFDKKAATTSFFEIVNFEKI